MPQNHGVGQFAAQNKTAAAAACTAGGESEQLLISIDQLSKQLNVSTRTISRWRRQGLDGREYVFAGHKRVGFSPSAVERFVRVYRDRVARATKFSQLTDCQRREIVSRARTLSERGYRPAEIIKRLAQQTGRNIETIRYTLKQYERRHPEARIFAPSTVHLSDRVKREIYEAYRRGESAGALAKRFGCSRITVLRAVAQMRLEQINQLPLQYVPNVQFDRVRCAEEEQAILAPAPPAKQSPAKLRRPAGLPSYLADLYEVPLLTREQEQHLFRKMNYLKYKASRLLCQIDPAQPSMALMDQVEELYQQSVFVKNEIMRANLRLVVSIAKRYARHSQSLFELVSDGNMSLLRAVEKFDFARGYKFSTYATWAIMKNFARSIPNEQRYHARFCTGREEMFEATEDPRADEYAEESAQRVREDQVARILEHLDQRERQIISYRFGLNSGRKPMTLKEIGEALGVTKECVRQLESRLLGKLRKAARLENIHAPAVGA